MSFLPPGGLQWLGRSGGRRSRVLMQNGIGAVIKLVVCEVAEDLESALGDPSRPATVQHVRTELLRRG